VNLRIQAWDSKFHQKSGSNTFPGISDVQSSSIWLEMNRSQSQLSVELWILKIRPDTGPIWKSGIIREKSHAWRIVSFWRRALCSNNTQENNVQNTQAAVSNLIHAALKCVTHNALSYAFLRLWLLTLAQSVEETHMETKYSKTSIKHTPNIKLIEEIIEKIAQIVRKAQVWCFSHNLSYFCNYTYFQN